MTKQTYIKLMEYLLWHKTLRKTLIAVERFLEVATVAAYLLLLIYTIYTDPGYTLLSAVTCVLALYICTMIRNVADRRRPYEVYETLPAMNKDSKGKSFPSRHLTSISVIAMSLLGVSLPLGILFLVFTAVMAALRVILGVHFIKDVAVGAAIGIIFGVIGIFIVPIFI